MTVPVAGDVAPGVVPDNRRESLEDVVASIASRMSEADRRTLYSVAVSNGDARILYVGPDLTGRPVFELRNGLPGVSAKFVLRTFYLSNGALIWALYDTAGNIIVSADGLSGGLARPWLPVPLVQCFTSASSPGIPTVNAPVAGVETLLWEGRVCVSHPRLQVNGTWGQASGSNSGTYRIKLNGTAAGTWTTAVGASRTSVEGPFDITAWLGQDNVTIQLTYTANASSTGQVLCAPWAVHQRQT
jgi:hypothetical protein